MPELPEVELYRRRMTEHILQKKILTIHTVNEGRMIPDGLEKLREIAVGQEFVDSSRVGKFLFLHLSNGIHLLWHFGMTGSPNIRSTDDRPHKHARILFDLDHDLSIDFVSPRKFSRLKIVPEIAAYQKAHNLGTDALKISAEEFIAAFARKKNGPVKSALLEQKYFAGVGNWIADEMLFQIRLHPETPCRELTRQQLGQLHQLMQQIIQETIDFEGDYKDLPGQYMVAHRWGDGLCPRCGEPLTRIEVGGRGTFFCTYELV